MSLKNNMPNLVHQKSEKKFLEKMHSPGGCLLKPQSKLLPHANASITSRGKFLLVIVGTTVQINKCDKTKIKNILFIFLFKLIIT